MNFIKFLLKTLLSLLILVFIFAVCILGVMIWSAPKLAPKAVDYWIEGKTGFSVTMGEVDLKVFSGKLEIDDIDLMNPPYFQNKNFLQVEEVSIKMEPRSIYRNK